MSNKIKPLTLLASGLFFIMVSQSASAFFCFSFGSSSRSSNNYNPSRMAYQPRPMIPPGYYAYPKHNYSKFRYRKLYPWEPSKPSYQYVTTATQPASKAIYTMVEVAPPSTASVGYID
jgi:hypothetical protein